VAWKIVSDGRCGNLDEQARDISRCFLCAFLKIVNMPSDLNNNPKNNKTMYNTENIKCMREMPKEELAMLREKAVQIANTNNPLNVYRVMMSIIDKRRKSQKI
jgi:hypothetical protein